MSLRSPTWLKGVDIMNVLKQSKTMSLQEFEKFCEHNDSPNTYELYDGELICHARPSIIHQKLMAFTVSQLYNSFEGKNCEVLTEVSVRLNKKEPTEYVPDILLLCGTDLNKLNDKYVDGAPYSRC